MRQAAHRLFGYPEGKEPHFIAAPTLSDPETREIITAAIDNAEPVLVYFQEKLGGELGISKTEVSPEFSFDWTLVEVLTVIPELSLGRFGIIELQTMDFHGSYAHATTLIRSALTSNPEGFHAYLSTEAGRQCLSKKMEGPNLSNVFKRTFYQMAYKFQLAGHSNCAGGAFAIPRSVWTSWARHLADPEMTELEDGTFALSRRGEQPSPPQGNSWIFIFELGRSIQARTDTMQLWRAVRTDADTLVELALHDSPRHALADGSPIHSVTEKARKRIKKEWPEIVPRKPRQNTSLF